MQKYRNKYEEVFQQLYQYDAFAVNTNKNIVKKLCKNWQVPGPVITNFPKLYTNLFSQAWSLSFFYPVYS